MALSPGIFGGELLWIWLTGQLVILGVSGDDCRITPVVHTLQYPGCNPLNVPSFSCVGKCTSYVQVSSKVHGNSVWMSDPIHLCLGKVSGAKIWQMERSCMCCQESGVREASVTLHCPKSPPGSPKLRKVMIILYWKQSTGKMTYFFLVRLWQKLR